MLGSVLPSHQKRNSSGHGVKHHMCCPLFHSTQEQEQKSRLGQAPTLAPTLAPIEMPSGFYEKLLCTTNLSPGSLFPPHSSIASNRRLHCVCPALSAICSILPGLSEIASGSRHRQLPKTCDCCTCAVRTATCSHFAGAENRLQSRWLDSLNSSITFSDRTQTEASRFLPPVPKSIGEPQLHIRAGFRMSLMVRYLR